MKKRICNKRSSGGTKVYHIVMVNYLQQLRSYRWDKRKYTDVQTKTITQYVRLSTGVK